MHAGQLGCLLRQAGRRSARAECSGTRPGIAAGHSAPCSTEPGSAATRGSSTADIVQLADDCGMSTAPMHVLRCTERTVQLRCRKWRMLH